MELSWSSGVGSHFFGGGVVWGGGQIWVVGAISDPPPLIMKERVIGDGEFRV